VGFPGEEPGHDAAAGMVRVQGAFSQTEDSGQDIASVLSIGILEDVKPGL
jgi:hypothetical protein